MIVMKNFQAALALLTAIAVLTAGQVSDAGLLRAMQPPVPPPMPPVEPIPMAAPSVGPACCVTTPPCCPTPCISYRHIGRPVDCCGCPAPTQTVLQVKNPCTCACCEVAIPVCLPGCCTGEPVVTCRHGLLACGIVTYEWCCGVKIVIRFKSPSDIIVTYHRA